jgi:small subunit ribosomal protein S17
MTEERKALIKTKTGRVTSDRMQNTVVVQVEMSKRHPIYGRILRRRTSFKAHDEKQEAHVGDLVRIEESRPISKEKHWRVVEILRQAEQF